MDQNEQHTYPPSLSEVEFRTRLADIADYQLTHGSLLTLPLLARLDASVPVARPIGVSVFPTPFPRALFFRARSLQPLLNILYARVAEDEEWLSGVLTGLRDNDELVAKLWAVWETVRASAGRPQPVRCGIWRGDYMLHDAPLPEEPVEANPPVAWRQGFSTRLQLKQVEFNTFSCAGGVHGNIAAGMHRYLCSRAQGVPSSCGIPGVIPENRTVESIVATLEAAHRLYQPSDVARPTAVLMTVQPRNINICDERPIEHGLASREPAVPLFRAAFADDVVRYCSLGPADELLYWPPQLRQPVEISVVYHRAGYDLDEYDDQGMLARVTLERSRAIQCPTVLAHLSGMKKVQQALALPGALERFVSPLEAEQLRDTFMPLYPLDDMSELGRRGRDLAMDADTSQDFVLKPSLEGGGHNFYGADIPPHLSRLPMAHWDKYILMKRIKPPPLDNVLMTPSGAYEGPVVSELGIFGGCIWRRTEAADGLADVIRNDCSGWSFKTKPSHQNEMSVVKGFGVFDGPMLWEGQIMPDSSNRGINDEVQEAAQYQPDRQSHHVSRAARPS